MIVCCWVELSVALFPPLTPLMSMITVSELSVLVSFVIVSVVVPVVLPAAIEIVLLDSV